MQKPLEKIVILGGGSAGWMAAAALAKALNKSQREIKVVDSSDIPSIGVGEATIPPILNFLKYLDINESDFIRHTQATYKLGIRFDDWLEKGSSYFHPFGSLGVNIDGNEFYPYFVKARQSGYSAKITDFSPAAQMAKAGTFYWPQKSPNDSFLAGAGYALHFDAAKVANYLKQYSLAHGVKHLQAKVLHATLDERGFIKTLITDDQDIEGDFFIDCSGFHAVLMEQTLQVGFEDWSQDLPCNRAVALPRMNNGRIAPYTVAKAEAFGWTWNIPLQNRSGHGYVYSENFCNDQQALDCLLRQNNEQTIAEPRLIKFTAGRRKSFWKNNCIALGLSSGFLEPLESTAIHLVTKGLRAFLDLLPRKDCNPTLALEYNRIMANEYECIKDFIVLHYCTTQRTDTEFWQYCRNMTPPDSLQEKMELFRTSGNLFHNPAELFKSPSWYCIYEGMGIKPQVYSPLADKTNLSETLKIMKQVKELMEKMASGLPAHETVLKNICE